MLARRGLGADSTNLSTFYDLMGGTQLLTGPPTGNPNDPLTLDNSSSPIMDWLQANQAIVFAGAAALVLFAILKRRR